VHPHTHVINMVSFAIDAAFHGADETPCRSRPGKPLWAAPL